MAFTISGVSSAEWLTCVALRRRCLGDRPPLAVRASDTERVGDRVARYLLVALSRDDMLRIEWLRLLEL